LGGYGGREVLKRALLVAEGIAIVGTRVPLQQYRVTGSAARAGRKNARRA
jgi:hypothetical protein